MDDFIKHREILFDPLHPDSNQARTAAGLLEEIDGILQARALSPTSLVVRYDLGRITLEAIDQLLSDTGFHLDNSLLSKLKRSLFHYTEETLRANVGCEQGQSNCTRKVFIQRYEQLPHGCRDERPEHWRHYL